MAWVAGRSCATNRAACWQHAERHHQPAQKHRRDKDDLREQHRHPRGGGDDANQDADAGAGQRQGHRREHEVQPVDGHLGVKQQGRGDDDDDASQ